MLIMENFVHSVWSMIPFGLMLLAIAIGPIKAEKFWESNINKLKVVLALSIPTAILLILGGLGSELCHQIVGDYLPFIILLAALFIITGGVHLSFCWQHCLLLLVVSIWKVILRQNHG